MASISFEELKNIIKIHPDYERKWKKDTDIEQALYISFSDKKPTPIDSDVIDLSCGNLLVLDKDKEGVIWGLEVC
ncbi:MAG: hypothetical protein K9K67_01060 [Bacteriovoracaceae bacterium]|nr:hypothetical protein [Bacteriovoracaceae bacterium]